jgi:hypothetical protein
LELQSVLQQRGVSMSGEARGLKILEGVVNTDLPLMGYPVANVKKQELNIDGNGDLTLFVSYTDTTYSTGDVAAFVRLRDANGVLPDSMRTQSHAYGQWAGGSFVPEVITEGPATLWSDHAKLVQNLVHILRGIFGSPCRMIVTDATVMPAVKGILAAGADANLEVAADVHHVDFGTGRGFVGGM